MAGVLVQEQDIAARHGDPLCVIDDCGQLALYHIEHLDIVMGVGRKIGEPGMEADIDQLSLGKEFLTVHDKLISRCIKIPF